MKIPNSLAALPLLALALFAPGSRACDECDDFADASGLAARSVDSHLSARQDLGNIFPIKEYPDQQVKNVTKYMAEARKVAKDDLCEQCEPLPCHVFADHRLLTV